MLCRPFGFPALNTKDLVADGDILSELGKILSDAPSENDIENALPGQSYIFIPDEDGPLERNEVKGYWIELRQIFPAEKMQVEIQFRNTVQSNNETIGQVGGRDFSSLGGSLGIGAAGSIIQSALNRNTGGLSAGTTKFALCVVESKTKFNIRKTITSEIKNTGIIEFSDYVQAIFAVTRDPQPLTDEIKDSIGKDSDRAAHGGIKGNPDANGQARVDATSELYDPDSELFDPELHDSDFDSNNKFKEIVYDDKAHFFQADNDTNEEYNYAWRYVRNNDLSSKKIRIDVDLFKVGDPVYITGSFVQKHNFRQIIKHKGILFDSSSVGQATPQIDFLGFQLQAYNFHFVTTRVPVGAETGNIFDRVNGTYNTNYVDVKGWRLTELVDKDLKDFYAADSRGIHLVSDGSVVETYISGASLKDQEWWDAYLDNSGYRNRDVDGNLGEIDYTGLMFDVSEHVNSVLIDQDKIGYHRPFALALMDAGETIGISNLDLIRRQIIGRSDYDLSSAVFMTANQISYLPGGYGGSTCGGLGEAGYYDPFDFFNENSLPTIGIPYPLGDIQTDWLLRIPIWTGKFGKDTRVHVESFVPDRVDAGGVAFSLVFIYTVPVLESSLSIDWNSYGTTAILSYKDEKTGYLSFHRFESGILANQSSNTDVSPELNHERTAYDHASFREIGYNRILGDAPSYSNGQIISNDYLNICNQVVPIEDIYTDVIFNRLDIGPSQEISFGIDGKMIRNISLDYKIYSDDIKNDNQYVSIYFEDNDLSIDNINIPFGSKDEEFTLSIDGKFYSGSSIVFLGDKISKINIKSIKLKTTEESIVEPYLLQGAYTSTVFDKQDNVYVFFENEDTQNIDVAISKDKGRNWFVLKGIIRLLEGETADIPTAIRFEDANMLYLFYRFNENTLARKILNFNMFNALDVLIDYTKPVSFDTDDDLSEFTEEGKMLRSKSAFFIVGDGEGAAENNFDEASYTVYQDSSGLLRIMYVQDGRANIISGSGINWDFEARNVPLHKNLITDSADKDDLPIENPSMFFDRYGGFVYIMYFHNEALFMRRFSSGTLKNGSGQSELNVIGEGEAAYSSENIKNAYEISEGSVSPPYFLVGVMPESIQSIIESGDEDELNKIVPRINFLTGEENLGSQFSEGFEINTSTKPVGYVSADGNVRIFYKNSDGQVCGLMFGGNNVVLDVQRKPKQ